MKPICTQSPVETAFALSGDAVKVTCSFEAAGESAHNPVPGSCNNTRYTFNVCAVYKDLHGRWLPYDSMRLPVFQTVPSGFSLQIRGAFEARHYLRALRDALNAIEFGPSDDDTHPQTACPGDSPIEQAFAKAWRALTGAYPQAQVQIGTYRVDFLVNRTVIELDGHAYHSSKEQRGHDAKRDRYLQSQGYRVVRFTGSEVHRDAAGCARQALELSK